jgi:hypothetical protein
MENPMSPACASTSLTRCDVGSLRTLHSDRLTYPDAVELVGKVIALFPNGSPPNAKGYIGGLAQILVAYPKAVAIECANPLKGVARELRFLPTPADLIAWLERESAWLRNSIQATDHIEQLAAAQRQRAEEERAADEQRKRRPALDELRAKYGPNWGIATGRKPPPTREQARTQLIAQVGQAAFDAMPEAGYDWQKLKAPPAQAAE